MSADTATTVRPIVKAPMLLILACCGVMTGLNLVVFTFLGELLQSKTFTDDPGLIIFLMFAGAVFSFVLLIVVNFTISLYD